MTINEATAKCGVRNWWRRCSLSLGKKEFCVEKCQQIMDWKHKREYFLVPAKSKYLVSLRGKRAGHCLPDKKRSRDIYLEARGPIIHLALPDNTGPGTWLNWFIIGLVEVKLSFQFGGGPSVCMLRRTMKGNPFLRETKVARLPTAFSPISLISAASLALIIDSAAAIRPRFSLLPLSVPLFA